MALVQVSSLGGVLAYVNLKNLAQEFLLFRCQLPKRLEKGRQHHAVFRRGRGGFRMRGRHNLVGQDFRGTGDLETQSLSGDSAVPTDRLFDSVSSEVSEIFGITSRDLHEYKNSKQGIKYIMPIIYHEG